MEGNEDEIEDIVRIELVIPDSIHFSGGTFCSFVNILPVASEKPKKNNSVTIDFISINLYGIVTYDTKLLTTSKFQNTLRFRFLQTERAELQQNQDLSLIFSSEPVVFCTFKEFSGNFDDLTYRFTSLIPPFLPPSFTGRHVSYSYFVYVTVQYRSSVKTKEIQVISKKLEFNLLGSIYQEFPLLDVKYYPILPKKGGFDLSSLHRLSESECAKVIKTQISESKTPSNLYFDFKSRVTEISREHTAHENSTNYLASRDLDFIWYLWDEFYESGSLYATDNRPVLESFNFIVDQFSNFNYDTDFYKINKYKHWFGNLFPPELHTGDGLDPENISMFLNVFLKKLERRMCSHYQISLEDVKAPSVPQHPERRYKDGETIGFTLDGNKLCTCTISGLKSVCDSEELEMSVASWFSVNFDFSESTRHCLKVQLTLQRLEGHANSVKLVPSNVVEESMISLGKSNGCIKSFLPSISVPSFKNSSVNLSYRLEIKFFCFEDPVDIFDQHSIKSGLSKLKMVQWTRPVRILQNDGLRLKLDEFGELDRKESLSSSRMFSKNKLSSFMFTTKKFQLYKVIKI